MKKKSPDLAVSLSLSLAAIFIPFIAALDTVLPFLFRLTAQYFMNRTPGVEGKIKSLRFSFFRKAILLKGLTMHYGNINAQEHTVALTIEEMKMGFEWLKLFKGQLVTDIVIKAPDAAIIHTHATASYAVSSAESTSAPGAIPVIVKQFAIENARIGYTDFTTSPNAVVQAEAFNLVINNISGEALTQATYKANLNARVCDGDLKMDVALRMDQMLPAFDLNVALQQLNLVKLNSFFMAYGKVDVSQGTLDLFAEAKADNGKFKGYVKPLVKDLKFTDDKNANPHLLKAMREAVAGVVMEMLENQKHDQVATEIPFEGTFNDPKVKVWKAVMLVFVNAFIQALSPTFNHRFDKEVTKID